MNPSTTVRASSSSEVIRARTSGARNLGAPEYACVVCPFDGSLVSVLFSLSQFIFVSEAFVSGTAPGAVATGSATRGLLPLPLPCRRCSTQSRFRLRHGFDQFLDHLIGIDSFGLGLEIEEDAM